MILVVNISDYQQSGSNVLTLIVYRCDCPEGFEGPRCQQLRHTFNGTGYALFKPLEQCENSRTSIEILTNKADGLILYNGPHGQPGQGEPRDFILLELSGGVPRMRINHGTGELSLTIQGSNPKLLNDGAWHRIDIHRTKKVIILLFFPYTWVKVFRIIPEFRILRLTFHRKSAS